MAWFTPIFRISPLIRSPISSLLPVGSQRLLCSSRHLLLPRTRSMACSSAFTSTDPGDMTAATRTVAWPKVAVGQMTAVGDQEANLATCRRLCEVGACAVPLRHEIEMGRVLHIPVAATPAVCLGVSCHGPSLHLGKCEDSPEDSSVSPTWL